MKVIFNHLTLGNVDPHTDYINTEELCFCIALHLSL